MPDQALLDFDFMYDAGPESRIDLSTIEEHLVEAHAVIKKVLAQTVRDDYATEMGMK